MAGARMQWSEGRRLIVVLAGSVPKGSGGMGGLMSSKDSGDSPQ